VNSEKKKTGKGNRSTPGPCVRPLRWGRVEGAGFGVLWGGVNDGEGKGEKKEKKTLGERGDVSRRGTPQKFCRFIESVTRINNAEKRGRARTTSEAGWLSRKRKDGRFE